MTPEQILWQILCQAGQLFVQSSKNLATAPALLNPSVHDQNILEWRIYLLAILLLASVTWIARRLRILDEKLSSWEKAQEDRMKDHFASCDKVKKADISLLPTLQTAVAKILAVLSRFYPKYGQYLYDQSLNKEEINRIPPEE